MPRARARGIDPFGHPQPAARRIALSPLSRTSAPVSTVSGPYQAYLSPATRIVSIGPVTSATLRERGLEPHVEAERHDIDGLVDALLADAV